MVNFLDSQSDAQRFAALLADYEQRLQALERTSKAAFTSIEGGTLDIYTEDGELAGTVGVQPDGGIALVPEPAAAVPPPIPTVPIVTGVLAGLVVTWDGQWDDSYEPPTDFSAIQVHVGTTADFTPDAMTLAATMADVTGGTTTIALEGYGERWVRLVALTTAGLTGPPSEAVAGTPRQAVEQDLINGIISEIKLAEDAVTAAKIALGAVNTTALADEAVTASKILAGAVTTAKLDALAVTAEKIASLAITTAKLDALAVTTDKLAVNSVTATKIAAGVIEATHIKAGALTADRLTVGLTGMLGQRFYDAGENAALWKIGGSSVATAAEAANLTTVSVADAQSGGTVMRAVGSVSGLWRPDFLIPFDPNLTYRVSATVRQTEAGADTAQQRFYLGVVGIAADRSTLVSSSGAAATTSAHYVGATGMPLTAGGGWQRVTGYLKGYAPAGTNGTSNTRSQPTNPGVLHASARYISPVLYLNYQFGTGTAEVDMVTIEAVETGVVNSVNIADGAVTASKLIAGGVGPAQLGVGTDGNIIADPSFEGDVSAQRVAGQANWSIVTPGNGTAKALQVNAAAASATSRGLTLAVQPAVPGTKVWLSIDYLASADWVGTSLWLYAQWQDASGTVLGNAELTTATDGTALGTWTTLSGIPALAAPANTAQVRVAVATNNSSAGTVRFDNVACRIVMASATAGGRAELSPQGLQLFDSAGEEAVALVTGRPNYLTLSAAGVPVATVDQEGKAGFQSLAVVEGLTLGGDELTTILDQRPRGIISYGYPTSTVTSTGTEIGYFELPATIEAGRMYRFKFQAVADYDSSFSGWAQILLRDGGASSPTINSPMLHHMVIHPSPGDYWTVELEFVAPASVIGEGYHRFLLSFVNREGAAGQTFELGLLATGRRNYFLIEDIGSELPPTGVHNTGGGSSAPPIVQYTKTYPATWSGSYSSRGSYNSYFGNSCYQGYYSSTNGMQASLIGFSSALASDLSGATIRKAEVYLYFDHWYNNSGGRAVIKAHNHASRPSTFSCDAEYRTISWAKNAGKWVDITSVFDSSRWRGIALDPNTSGLTYYGRARGYGQTNPPKLRVTYTK